MRHLRPRRSAPVESGRHRRPPKKRAARDRVCDRQPTWAEVDTVALITRSARSNPAPLRSPSQGVARLGLPSVRPTSGIHSHETEVAVAAVEEQKVSSA